MNQIAALWVCSVEKLLLNLIIGTLKVKISSQTMVVFEKKVYAPLISLLKQDDFFILQLLGRVSNAREDVAKSLIRVFDSGYTEFVNKIIRMEIMQAPDSQTLFRANSMGSKALDIYMKHEGFKYLQSTIEDVLKLFLMSKKSFEVIFVLLDWFNVLIVGSNSN